MNYNKLLLTTGFVCAVVFNADAGKVDCKHGNDKLKCLEFVKNYDGDTATFNIPHLHPLLGKDLKVSLGDVKSPSIYSKNKCEKAIAKKAKFYVRKTLKEAKYIEAGNIKRDKSFGVKASVFVDGANLSDILVKQKMAVPTKDYKKTDWCKLS